MKKTCFLLSALLLFSTICIAQKDILKNEVRHSIGFNVIPTFESIFMFGGFAQNIAYGYKIDTLTKFCSSLYFSEKNEKSQLMTYLNRNYNLSSILVKAGMQHIYNWNYKKTIFSYFAYYIGYTKNNLKGNFMLTEHNFGQSALIPYHQNYNAFFFELQLGKQFIINKDLFIAANLITGCKTLLKEWPVNSIPGLGIGSSLLYFNFQTELWLNLKKKRK